MATKAKQEEIQEEIEIKVVNPHADAHHMIQRIGTQQTLDGAITGDQADAMLRTWLQAGYRLAFVHPLGLEPAGANILYILVKDA